MNQGVEMEIEGKSKVMLVAKVGNGQKLGGGVSSTEGTAMPEWLIEGIGTGGPLVVGTVTWIGKQ